MKKRPLVAMAAITASVSVSVAVASHVAQVDPASVPTGFLAAHNSIKDVPISSLARAAASGGADVFVQHVQLGPGVATGWHTHPGPALVEVVKGSLTYEDEKASECRQLPYGEGSGFVDRGFGHVHRVVAGAQGVDFYVVYILPPGSATHLIPAAAPAACS
jgi:quercetin dioxygenase-like cupin family protein